MSLCLVAGTGRLPALIASAADNVAALEGVEAEIDAPWRFRLETLGTFLGDLRVAGTDRICFAGGIPRPQVDPSRIDAATAPLVPRIAAALRQGDDAALRVVLELCEEHGIAPVGAHEIRPDLLPRPGPLGACTPSAADLRDAERAFDVLRLTGAADLGQGCVVAGGQVLAVEALPGTDWMLATIKAARAERRTGGELAIPMPGGGVLAKAPKPDQDRRVDLPAIGPATIFAAIEAGLSGIAISAGGVMVLDAADAAARADAAGLWVQVVE